MTASIDLGFLLLLRQEMQIMVRAQPLYEDHLGPSVMENVHLFESLEVIRRRYSLRGVTSAPPDAQDSALPT